MTLVGLNTMSKQLTIGREKNVENASFIQRTTSVADDEIGLQSEATELHIRKLE